MQTSINVFETVQELKEDLVREKDEQESYMEGRNAAAQVPM
jgi:hypothetical protein